MRFNSRAAVGCFLALLALVCAAGLSFGQAGTSTIRGTVNDATGAVIPGATVTLTNPATGLTRTQITTEVGGFSFELIPPGTYTIEAESKGFKKRAVNGVQALVGAPTEVKIQMELGNVTETVTVEAGAAAVAVNTQDASLGNNFVSQQIAFLPIEARNLTSLLSLQPGVTRDGYVAGARSDQSNVTLDGVDINEAQTNDINSAVLRLNSTAIREFRVNTMSPNADLGRSSAAQVNLVTKNGTNDFHGAVFEFYRSVGMTANSFFNNRATPVVPRTPLLRHTFSGEVDGPIIKDKLFFMYSYEGRRDTTARNVVRTVPLASLGQGQLRYVDANGTTQSLTTAQLNEIFPAVGINPAAVAVLADAAKKYPANTFDVGDKLNTGGFRFNAPTPVNLNSNILRFDWNISNSQTTFVRLAKIYDLTGVAAQFPDTPAPNTWSHPSGIAVGHTWTVSPRVVNSFRYGLTRQAFSTLGDSGANAMHFRFVYEPYAYTRTIARTTPVHNFVDDVSWVRGSHTLQFGTNMRIIRNNRNNYANAYDDMTTNPSGYVGGGNVLSDPIIAYLDANNLPAMSSSSVSNAQNAAAALIGRLSGYTANFNFKADGSLLEPGTPSTRNFATEDYDFYFQDAWKMRPNLTVTLGLRYGLSRPVYETQGLEVRPDPPLGEYFQRRLAGAAAGTPVNDLISVNLSGPANGKPGMYDWDKSGWQPRAAVAWSPRFDSGWLRSLFGDKSVLRAGFGIMNDYFGEALATFFDNNNTLGFSSSDPIPVNTYNVTSRPPPLFTGFGQDVRTLPRITVPDSLKFPLVFPSGVTGDIQASLDSNLVLPRQYTFTMTYERELPKGMLIQASYMGRLGRNLLAQRDIMQLNDLVDKKSGMDWYTAATTLEKIRQTRPPSNYAVPTMPYFDNIFPSNLRDVMVDYYGDDRIPAGFTPTQTIFWIARNYWGNDWTDLQFDQDLSRFSLGQDPLFMQPQFGALAAWSTIAYSNYHGMSLSIRQRTGSLNWDFNYTFSHSLDNASGLQNAASYGGGAFIFNSIRPDDYYGNSGFDIRHQINVNAVYDLPVGRGRLLGSGMNAVADSILGGWKLSGIYRWNTGLPLDAPFDDARWATNWQVQSNGILTRPLEPCVTKNPPKLFGCDPKAAYQSFRNPYPGESGMRNVFRLPGYVSLDMGLNKSFNLGKSENRRLELRWEVFNVTNTQRFGSMDLSRSGFGIALDPAVRNLNPPANWSNFTGIQGTPRVMQIGASFHF